MAVWYKDSNGIDHYGTPSTTSESASVATSTQPSGSLSSYSGGGGSGGGSSPSLIPSTPTPSVTPTNINTSGLTGYALAYANARNQGLNDVASHAAATLATGNAGNGGTGTNFTTFDSGTGGNGNGTTSYNLDMLGNYSPTKTSLIPAIIEQPKTPLIPEVPKIPEYIPYQPKEFQATTPNYSISADPSKTSFIPTARAKDRWLQQEQMNADNAYKQYTSQFGAYQQTYKQQQDAITNALAQKELETKTIAEQAAAALKAAGVKSEAEKVALTAAQNRWQTLGYVANEADAALLGVPVGTKTNDASYRDATLAKSGGGGSGGSSSGITPYQEFQITNTVDAAARDYAKMMAEDEGRIGKPGTYVDANGQTQGVANTYQQIYDAYYQKYLQDYWGKQ